MPREITVFYLAMSSPADLRPATRPSEPLRVERAAIPYGALNRFFYTTVGGPYHWTDRFGWSDAAWQAYAEQPGLELWLGYLDGTPVGYYELYRQPDTVEIAYFGLLPPFIGRGLGGALLTACVEWAWASGPQQVQLNTCTLDGPHALANYLARGFQHVRQETRVVDLE